MAKIHCSVNNCNYWATNNICDASEIMVTSDSFATSAPDSIDAPKAMTVSPTPVGTCMETCCKTYVAKGDTDKTKDGIKRM